MPRTKTVYEGSSECSSCGTLITPVEMLWGDLCPDCRAARVQRLIRNRMVDEG